ncbi:MAG TPA: SLC13 family permease [Blastocatellia bacterium]|nr:SLC13 family permease [Blastocatellia bacterium]
MHIAIVLVLLILAVVLFATERMSVDVVTLLLLIVLILTGILTPVEAFSGFSSEIIILLACIFVISGALHQTGVMDAVGATVHRIAGSSENRLLAILMSLVGALSAFMNNTTVTAVFLSPVLTVARRRNISPSRLLIPLAYASMLGGTCTLIGTSTNVAVSGYIARVGLRPIGLFELAPIGLVILAVGVCYMVFVGKRLLPAHEEQSLTSEYAIREYLSEVVVLPGSSLIGQRIFQSNLSKMDLRVLEVLREGNRLLPEPTSTIERDDLLLVAGNIENLLRIKEAVGIQIRADVIFDDRDLQSGGFSIAEVLITAQSDLSGRTLRESSFRQRFGLSVLAIYRHGQSLRNRIADIKLRLGDLLLVQGPSDRLEAVRQDPDLWVIGERTPVLYKRRRGLITVAIMSAAILVGALGWLPLSIAFLIAAILIVVFRCLTMEQAYEFIDWRLLILIGGMTAFGAAMDKTGAALFLANFLVRHIAPMGLTVLLAGFFVLTIVLTQPMSNAAAALVVLPVALRTAEGLSVNPRTFAISVMLAASISFIAPFEPACILVYGPGKYRFRDFLKTGVALTLLLAVVILLLIPVLWPLKLDIQ